MSEPRPPTRRSPRLTRAWVALILLTVATAALVAGAWIVAGLGAALIVGGCVVGIVGFFLALEA